MALALALDLDLVCALACALACAGWGGTAVPGSLVEGEGEGGIRSLPGAPPSAAGRIHATGDSPSGRTHVCTEEEPLLMRKIREEERGRCPKLVQSG